MSRALEFVFNHPFYCDRCPGSFTRREHLSRHYRTHEQVKPSERSVCKRTFGRKDLRDRHERNVHQVVRCTAPRTHIGGQNFNDFSDGDFMPTKSAAMAMSFELQRSYLQVFFTCFAPSLPLIHQATFNPTLRSPGLVRSMAAIGCSFSINPDIAKTSRVMLAERLAFVRQLAGSISLDDSRCFDLTTEILVLFFFTLSQMGGTGLDVSQNSFRQGIDLARNLGVGRAQASKVLRAPESLHHRWLEWIRYETYKRLGLLYFVTDSLAASLLNSSSNMVFCENKQTLPVNEMLWNAKSAEEWHMVCLSVTAPSESLAVEAMDILLTSCRVPIALTELSSVLLSIGLLNNILDLSSWIALNASRIRDLPSVPQQVDTGLWCGPEVHIRKAELKFSLNVMLNRVRNQRLNTPVPSRMWDITTTILQFGYLRLYLPSSQASHGLVSSDWTEMLQDTVHRVLKEDLSYINYCSVVLLLHFFIELILGQLHLQYRRDSSSMGNASHCAVESTMECVILVQVMFDIWRLLRFTLLHTSQISSSPELALARQSFVSALAELSGSLGGLQGKTTIIQEDELARLLAQLCLNMYSATRMSTFQLVAETFANLLELLNKKRH